MELYYHRRESGRVQTVVVYLPDIRACVPTADEWPVLKRQYKGALQRVLDQNSNSSKASNSNPDSGSGSKGASGGEAAKKAPETVKEGEGAKKKMEEKEKKAVEEKKADQKEEIGAEVEKEEAAAKENLAVDDKAVNLNLRLLFNLTYKLYSPLFDHSIFTCLWFVDP